MESLEEILNRLKIERFAENIDYEDLPLESVASMSQIQLQKNFRIDKESAKKLFKELEALRRKKLIQSNNIETPRRNPFNFFNPQFYTPKNMTNFVASFTKLSNVSYKPGDEWSMNVVGAAMSASSRAFYNMFTREGSNEQYGDPNKAQNNSGWTALMFATAMGRDNIVQLMLERNVCNFLAKNDKGESAMMIAASFGHVRVIELLFDGFRKYLQKHPDDQNANHSHMDIITQQDNNGFTPLHFAAYYAQADAVQLLLQLGAPPNVPDSAGMTPTLHACSDEGQEACLKMLLQVGGNLDLRNAEGKNGLEISGNRETVKRMYFDICKREPTVQSSSAYRHQHLYGSF